MSANYTELKSRIAAINFFVRLLSNGNWEVTNCETGKTREFNHDLEYIVENLEAIHARRAAEAVATAEAEAEAEVVETVATIDVSTLSNYDIVTLAENNGFRVSLQPSGEWFLIRKADRMVTNIGYNLKDAVAIINPASETMSQVEIERGYAAQEAEEHAAWVEESLAEPVVDVLDDEDESGDHGYSVPEEQEDLSFIEAVELLHQAGRRRVSEEMVEEARSVVVSALAIELDAREVPFNNNDLRDWVACTNFSGNELIGSLADEWIDENGITAPNWSAAANQYDAWLKENYA